MRVLQMKVTGSPPPMRGKVADFVNGTPGTGITPAYAGKSYDGKIVVDNPPGSPPPMRGKGQSSGGGGRRFGITPAYAGKRVRQRSCIPQPKDHPRLCGEKQNCCISSISALGSPPPMRGKGNNQGRTGYRHRITPAYAGKRKI